MVFNPNNSGSENKVNRNLENKGPGVKSGMDGSTVPEVPSDVEGSLTFLTYEGQVKAEPFHSIDLAYWTSSNQLWVTYPEDQYFPAVCIWDEGQSIVVIPIAGADKKKFWTDHTGFSKINPDPMNPCHAVAQYRENVDGHIVLLKQVKDDPSRFCWNIAKDNMMIYEQFEPDPDPDYPPRMFFLSYRGRVESRTIGGLSIANCFDQNWWDSQSWGVCFPAVCQLYEGHIVVVPLECVDRKKFWKDHTGIEVSRKGDQVLVDYREDGDGHFIRIKPQKDLDL